MTFVRISYSPNLHDIGKVREVDEDTARSMIRQGRAVRVYEADNSPSDPDGPRDTETPPAPVEAEPIAAPQPRSRIVRARAGVAVASAAGIDTTATPDPAD